MWITFPHQSCHVLYSFSACLQHSIIIWLTVLLYFLQVFHTNDSWWYFTGVWVTASLISLQVPHLNMVSVFPRVSNSSSPLSKPLQIILSSSATICITVSLMFFNFFTSLAKSKYLFIFSFSFIFTQWSTGTANSFFLLINPSSGFLVGIRWVHILKNVILPDRFWFVHIHLGVRSNFNFLHNSQLYRSLGYFKIICLYFWFLICIKFCGFCTDLHHHFPIPSLYRFALKNSW